jgi:hypothetical protein
MKVVIVVLFVASSVLVPTFGQRKNVIRAKTDLRLDKRKPSVFISFDHLGRRPPLEQGESNEGVWLRLNNNTRVSIFFASFSVPKALGEVGMFYDIISTSYKSNYHDPSLMTPPAEEQELPVGYTLGHTSSAYLLRSGQSVLFSVPREHLPDRVGLRISFNYEWELEGEMEFVRKDEPKHFVFFYSSRLPN